MGGTVDVLQLVARQLGDHSGVFVELLGDVEQRYAYVASQ